MLARGGKRRVAGVGLLSLFVFFNLSLVNLVAADPMVGTWNYSTSNHWVKGPAPAGKPSEGNVEITQSGGQFKMEFKSGMVFNPPQLKYFTGEKKGKDYVFSNSAKVDNEGGIAKNNCTFKLISNNHFEGKSFSEYSQSGITFSWGFNIELKR